MPNETEIPLRSPENRQCPLHGVAWEMLGVAIARCPEEPAGHFWFWQPGAEYWSHTFNPLLGVVYSVLTRERDAAQREIVHLRTQIAALATERDQWKTRALSAERVTTVPDVAKGR